MDITKKINPNTFEPDAEKLTLKEKYDHLTKVCKNQEKLNTLILEDILNRFLTLYNNNIKLKKTDRNLGKSTKRRKK